VSRKGIRFLGGSLLGHGLGFVDAIGAQISLGNILVSVGVLSVQPHGLTGGSESFFILANLAVGKGEIVVRG
jgi:hypothetical protein